MQSAGGSPPRESPSRVETLHESERTRVTRLFLPDRTVVRKQPLGQGAHKRLRQELGILQRLRGVDGVVQLADGPAYPDSIMLRDLGDRCLAHRKMPLPVEELTRLALDLAGVVAAMHRHGVMHRDISPANIMLPGRRPRPCLIDFALATSFAEIRPEFTHHNQIVGTLAYLAPEQTGRTGRPVDQRADLYALGATLYEMATGEPPFGTGDPLKLSHDHLARVPVPPTRVNPEVPETLSRIIMHLLEKEPDNRYQTAQGLIYDLSSLRQGSSDAQTRPLARIGEHDLPLRLMPPSRLVGRDAEIAALSTAFEAAIAGRCRAVLVSGDAGVGKTSLIDELRPIVTASDGWFVAGKFDQYRRDQDFDGVLQAFRGLGRLLLAEPEDELDELRERILDALGPNAGLAAAVSGEFALLLKVPPDAGDPLTAQVRADRNGVEILRAVASRKRPVVFVIDDLQWAGRVPLGFLDLVLSGEGVDGLLVVGAYRADEVGATHPLSALLTRWQRQGSLLEQLWLDNLPLASVAAMVADMLRVDPAAATSLARAIEPHTRGNPYDTVDLLNALRQHGVLAATAEGWRWDAATLDRYLGRADVAELSATRPDTLPADTRTLLETMACLGGRVELSLLQTASGDPAVPVEMRLAPALEEGLLVMEPGRQEAVRFRHDRVREATLRRLGAGQTSLRLAMARRLARVPELFPVAAEQYLFAADAVRDSAERTVAVEMFRHAAEQAAVLGNYDLVDRLLGAAVRLTDPADTGALLDMYTGRHTALYSLGRLDEADDVYQTIERLSSSAIQRTEATLTQVSSLTNRNRYRAAIALGVDLLRQLGVAVPAEEQLAVDIDRRLDALYRWLDETSETDDLAHPGITDATVLAAAALINRIMPAAYFSDQATMAWLSLEALRIWGEHGPGRTLVGPASHIPYVTIGVRDDYASGYQAARRILTVGAARGYEPDASQARFLFALSCHWFEPLEEAVAQAQQAREGLIQGGDLANGGYTYYVTVYGLLDCAPTLGHYVSELDAGLAYAQRTGSEQVGESLRVFRSLVGLLRGESRDETADVLSAQRYTSNPLAMVHVHINRALAGAVFGDAAELTRHIDAAMPMLPAIVGTYPTALAHLLHGLALAGQARAAPVEQRRPLLVRLDDTVTWLAARAADAPVNFLALLRLVEAERAWVIGDFGAAVHAFDAALGEVSAGRRPWHRALIAERAARFYLANGMEHTGYGLLAQARGEYQAWGAAAKVDQLDWAYPRLATLAAVAAPAGGPAARVAPANGDLALRAAQAWRADGSPNGDRPGSPAGRRRSAITTGTIDLLGILSASRALSSETSVEGLRTRVVEILSAMTGASGVQFLLWSHDRQEWLVVAPDGDTTPIEEAGHRRLVPMSVFRYAERIGEPLVVGDATHDDRFARDPYFAGVDCCSLLAVPIHNRGRPQALLLLENRLIRSAFSAERLDGVMLIAGQLAVSLDNAMVYTSLEHKVAERTSELALANTRLEQLSVTDPVTGLANRRRLEEALHAEWQGAQRAARPVALAMIDIDHFKLYNDYYGHAAGDRCLQRIATTLSQGIHGTDLIARYGGEEFAVVMPGTDITGAVQAAERLRAAVVGLAEPHPLATEHIATVSIGVASTVPTVGSEAESLVESADVELYRAKRSGRNRVRAALSGDMPRP